LRNPFGPIADLLARVLVLALASDDASLRAAAAKGASEGPASLGEQEEVVAPLVEALQDESDEVRRAAAESLERLRPGLVRAELLGAIETARREGYNPYVAGGPVQEDGIFFGRKDVLDVVLNTIHNNSLLLFGERRIGKTSILHRLRHRLKELEHPAASLFPVFVSLQGVPERRFFFALAERILEACPCPASLSRPSAEPDD
jgi:hypothetical protein